MGTIRADDSHNISTSPLKYPNNKPVNYQATIDNPGSCDTLFHDVISIGVFFHNLSYVTDQNKNNTYNNLCNDNKSYNNNKNNTYNKQYKDNKNNNDNNNKALS